MIDRGLLLDSQRTRRIVELADAGRFTVPAEWRRMLDAAALVEAWAGSGVPDVTSREAVAALELQAIEAVRAAALAGRKLPDAPVASYTAAFRALADPLEQEARTSIFEATLAQADGGVLVQLRRSVTAGFERFVLRALKPAHTAVLAELKAAGQLVGHIEDRGAEELDGIDGGRQTWDRIAHELLPRYHALHEAHQLGWTIAVAPRIADAGERHERETQIAYRNRWELHPDVRTGAPPADMPEAAGPLALWLTTVAEPWLPVLGDFNQLDVDRRESMNEQARVATRRALGLPREADGPHCVHCGQPVSSTGTGWVSDQTGIACDQAADGLHDAGAPEPAPAA
jgi:hypothetical protein